MASGREHFIANCLWGGGLSLVAWSFLPREQAIYFTTGCLIGALATPDLDIDHRTFTEELMWGFAPFGWFYQQFWYGYALAFKHRGLSHNVILGTAGRVLWATLIILCIAAAISGVAAWLHIYSGSALLTAEMVILFMLQPALLLGWFLQDVNHLAMDWAFSEREA
jgi:uncharacterized metal-binding protein